MFDDLVLSGKTKRTHKSWTVLLSTIVQTLVLGVMILIPLIYTEALPKTLLSTFLVAPPPPPPQPPAAAPVKAVRPKIIPTQSAVAPRVIPKNVEIVKDEAPDLVGVDGGFGITNNGSGPLNTILGGPSGPAPPKPAAPARIKVGGQVQAAKMLHQTLPAYPAIAKTAHVAGTIVLHAIIAKDGTVQALEYISGPPLLMKAAMDAVRDWRYTPTQLNGDPVEVDTTISVVFSLGS
jgi:protein TonB